MATGLEDIFLKWGEVKVRLVNLPQPRADAVKSAAAKGDADKQVALDL